MVRRKCKVRLVCDVIAYIQYNDKGEAVDFDELDDLLNVDEFEVKSIIN